MPSITTSKRAMHKKRKVKHIHIERAKNGYTVSHSLHPAPMAKGKTPPGGMHGMGWEPDPNPSVFMDKEGMVQHVGELADRMGEPDVDTN